MPVTDSVLIAKFNQRVNAKIDAHNRHVTHFNERGESDGTMSFLIHELVRLEVEIETLRARLSTPETFPPES